MEFIAAERTLTELHHARLTRLVHRQNRGRRDGSPESPIEQVLATPLDGRLLGRTVGATVHGPGPSGGGWIAAIRKILFQPESSGDFAI